MMYYTGARPEEIAGLDLSDIQRDDKLGWCFTITDIMDSDDCLFDDELGSDRDSTENVCLRIILRVDKSWLQKSC